MISIAVVTKRAGFALTMHSPGHHFTEVRPATGWLERPLPEDVMVLDLETAPATAAAISTLRSSGVTQPIIVVANDTDGWDGLIADHADLFLVSLPVTQTALLSTVDRAARLAGVVPIVDTDAPVEVDRGAGDDTFPGVVTPSTRGVTGSDSLATVPSRLSRSWSSQSTTPGIAPSPPAVAAALPSLSGDEPVQLVRQLRPFVGQLSPVPEVAELLRQRCASAVPCEASAVLVPDGSIWRVAAGHNLRPLEARLQIGAMHWLVSELVAQRHGVLVRDTDIVRTRLSGAPLAAWPNLMALPVVEVDAVVLLARQAKEFARGDLTKGMQSIGHTARQLAEAMDVRDLARALSSFANPVE